MNPRAIVARLVELMLQYLHRRGPEPVPVNVSPLAVMFGGAT